MTAGIYDVTIEQGAGFDLPLVYRNPTINGVPGNPIDITGYHAHMQVRQTPDDIDALLTLDDGINGGITITGLLGKIDIQMTSGQTQAFGAAFLPGFYDIKLFPPLAQPMRFLQGRFFVRPAISN